MPTLDDDQNVELISSSRENDITTLTFTRSMDTGDSVDVSFTGNECFYFLFPAVGGTYGDDGTISPHQALPIVSTEKICMHQCRK
jgi:hypothetical protein